MLERTLEPEVMESEQEALEYNQMDHRAVNVDFVDGFLDLLASHGKRLINSDDPDFEQLDDPNVIASVLDVGTGTALIPIELCQRNQRLRIMAIDLASSMLDVAAQNVDLAGFRNAIQLAPEDAKETNFDDEMFDATISNSIIHHIGEPARVVAEILRTTRAGGAIFVRDLMRPASEDTVNELVQTWAGSESAYSQRLFRDSLHASLTLNEMQELVAGFGIDRQTVTATSDRHWTWATIR